MGRYQFRRVFLVLLVIFVQSVFSQVSWVRKYDDALKQAAAEGKFVIVDVAASWCPPCQEMAKSVYPDPEFAEFSRTQIFVLVDEAEPEGSRVANKYKVQAYPTLLVLNAKGEEIDRLVGGRDARALIRDIKQLLANPVPYGDAVKQAMEKNSDFDTQYRVGERALDRQDYARARQFLSRAAALSGDRSLENRSMIFVLLARACFKDGKYQESLDALNSLDKLDSRLAAGVQSLAILRARTLIALKKYDEGNAILTDVLRGSRSRSEVQEAQKVRGELPGKYRKGNKDYAAAVEKAKENLKKGKLEAAYELAAKAGESAPQAVEVHVVMAAIHFSRSEKASDPREKNGYISSGLHELRLARRLDPEDINTFVAARRFLATRYVPEFPESQEAKKSYAEAEQRFVEERYDDAAKEYLRVIDQEPRFGKAYLHLGDCFFAKGRLEEALKWYAKASAATPLDASTYRFTADTLIKLGKTDEARDYIVKSLLADPEYPLAWKNLEADARLRGQHMERHNEIVPYEFLLVSMDEKNYDDKLFENIPQETVPAWREYVKTKLLWKKEKFAQQFPKEGFYHASFQEEYEALQQTVNVWSGLKESNPGLQDEKLDFVRQAAIDGMLAPLVFMEFYTEEYRPQFEAWKKKEGEKAIEYIDNYILNAPVAKSRGKYNSSAIEAYNAGVSQHKSGDDDLALASYGKALAQEPNMVPALQNASQIHLARSEYDEARELLRRWADADPGSARPLVLMAQIEINGSRNLGAGAALLERAVEIEQDPADKASYSEMLTRIRNASAATAVSAPPPDAPARGRPTLVREPSSDRQPDKEPAGSPRAAASAPAPESPPREKTAVLAREPSGDRQPGVESAENPEPSDQIGKLERRLASASDPAEKDWLHMMLGLAHFQAQHWKEAQHYLGKVLEKDPDNLSARQMMTTIQNMEKPK